MQEKLINEITSWIKEVCAPFKGAVLGLSGGLDSAVVAALCSRAKINTHALIMPTKNSSSINYEDAKSLSEQFGLICSEIKIDELTEAYAKLLGFVDADDMVAKACIRYSNLCARTRMALLYDYSYKHSLLVAGTSNLSELKLGYFTMWGDMASGFNPIGDFYKSELKELAAALGISEQIINKKPSADFYANQSDEADLGFTYEIIDEQLRRIENNQLIDLKFASIEARVKNNAFKLQPIKCFKRSK